MRSKWFDLKEVAMDRRREGISITVIERELGIPRSTLSGWFKNITLTESQRTRLMKNKSDGWKIARINAVKAHNAGKALRLLQAKKEAEKVLSNIAFTPELLDIAFAMLYLGEGSKTNGTTSIASSDPRILRFILSVLKHNYDISTDMVRCELHLRMDQDVLVTKSYWSKELDVPLDRFRYVAFDKRSENKPTYENYKGVCVLQCGNVQIQRKLMYLYTMFCDKVSQIYGGD